MLQTIDYLQNGNEKQQKAYTAIQSLNIMNDLQKFTPILCGTIPLGIDTDNSDLDIIMEVRQFSRFEQKIRRLYSIHDHFQMKHTNIRGRKVIKANFTYQDFGFELFGQDQPVSEQYAYLHMIIEYTLLQQQSDLKEKVIKLKKIGYKTEPAFCEVLKIPGDPYDSLIAYGKSSGILK